jgi:hypothetical protein
MTRAIARLAALVPLAGLVGATALLACSDETSPSPEAPAKTPDGATAITPPSSALPQGSAEIGQFEGRFDAKTKKLSFRAIDAASVAKNALPGPVTQGFGEVKSGLLDITTESAVVGPDPSYNGGLGCAANRLCAVVNVANTSAGRTIDTTFVQVTSVSPAGFVAANSDAVPTGYPLDASLGLWAHNNLSVGGGSSARWDFVLPDPDSDFTFGVTVYGTFQRTALGGSGATVAAASNTLDNSGSFRNACAAPITPLAGSPFLVNAAPGSDNSGAEVALPFPFTLYDVTFDTDLNPYLLINTNGSLGFQSPGNNANVTLPDGSSLYDYTIFPFWTSLTVGSSGVCVGTEGAAPNRSLVVTWPNATIAGAGKLTFSAVLREGSDQIAFQYNRWSTTTGSCASIPSGPFRGGASTIGVQGPGTTATLTSFNNGTFLPVHAAACPGPGYQVTYAASLANPLGRGKGEVRPAGSPAGLASFVAAALPYFAFATALPARTNAAARSSPTSASTSRSACSGVTSNASVSALASACGEEPSAARSVFQTNRPVSLSVK